MKEENKMTLHLMMSHISIYVAGAIENTYLFIICLIVFFIGILNITILYDNKGDSNGKMSKVRK